MPRGHIDIHKGDRIGLFDSVGIVGKDFCKLGLNSLLVANVLYYILNLNNIMYSISAVGVVCKNKLVGVGCRNGCKGVLVRKGNGGCCRILFLTACNKGKKGCKAEHNRDNSCNRFHSSPPKNLYVLI